MSGIDRKRAAPSDRSRAARLVRTLLALAACLDLGACASGAPRSPSSTGGDPGGAAVADGGSSPEGASGRDPYAAWRALRASREADLEAYLASHEAGLEAMLYGPIGDFGIPRVTLEAFPTVMPDRWGPPEEKLAAVGLGPDLHDPTNPLPLGIATFQSGGTELAIFSCAACHVGRVIGPDGNEHLVIGAPNTRFNAVFTAFEDTAADPRFDRLGGGLAAKTVQEALLLRRRVEDRTIGGFTYDRGVFPNAPDPFANDRRGFFDSYAVILAMRTLPESLLPGTDSTLAAVMPPAPGEADIMSLWRQRARPIAEWDGSLPHPVYRNLAASIGAVGFSNVVNFDVSNTVAGFAKDLPSPPYPFDVDMERAARGESLFQRYCASCHHDGTTEIFPASFTGTDPNRARSVTTAGRDRLVTALRNACTDPAVCDVPDDQIVADLSNGAARGYMAVPLHGIWARAPYLHNGSVPTLRHLLVPDSRPIGFFRGAIRYDERNVGFVWDGSATEEKYVDWFDTRLAGRSSAGHSSAAFLGIDWASHPDELEDLLEYLKTL